MSHSLQYIVDSTRVNIGTSCSRLDMHFHLTISHKVLRKTASLADDGKGSHEEGEHHRCLLDFLQSVQDGQANQLHKGVKVHTLRWQLLNVLVLRIVLGLPNEPQKDAVRKIVACQGGNAHVEEDALKNCSWNELQHRGQEEGQPNPGCPVSSNLQQIL